MVVCLDRLLAIRVNDYVSIVSREHKLMPGVEYIVVQIVKL